MIYATGTITTEVRQEIGETVNALQGCINRAERNNRKLLKMEADLADLEDEHAELSGKRQLTRAEGNTIQTVIAQKTRLARTIEEESGGAEKDRQVISATLNACQPLLGNLVALAIAQVRREVAKVLTPFFQVAANRVSEAARGTDLEQNLIGTFRRSSFAPGSSLADTLTLARDTVALLESIAADQDFCSLEPAPAAIAAAA